MTKDELSPLALPTSRISRLLLTARSQSQWHIRSGAPNATQDFDFAFMKELLGKADIRALIPHSGLMCLLDGVIEWDDRAIVCVSDSHRDPANPLRRDGQLAAVHVLEYAAQATAVHGGLRAKAADETAPPGYLAAVRDVQLHVARLDDLVSPLRIHATRLFGETANVIYECKVTAADLAIAEARITIMLRA